MIFETYFANQVLILVIYFANNLQLLKVVLIRIFGDFKKL